MDAHQKFQNQNGVSPHRILLVQVLARRVRLLALDFVVLADVVHLLHFLETAVAVSPANMASAQSITELGEETLFEEWAVRKFCGFCLGWCSSFYRNHVLGF